MEKDTKRKIIKKSLKNFIGCWVSARDIFNNIYKNSIRKEDAIGNTRTISMYLHEKKFPSRGLFTQAKTYFILEELI